MINNQFGLKFNQLQCEKCNIYFAQSIDCLIDHYLVNHGDIKVLQTLKNKNIRVALGLDEEEIISNKTSESNINQRAPEPNIKQKAPVINIKERECEICSEYLDPNYHIYVKHLISCHNLNDININVKDNYILDIIQSGKFKLKKCDLCCKEMPTEIFEYILHIQVNHTDHISSTLKNKIKDKFVLSVLLKNEVSNQDNKIFKCPFDCKEVFSDKTLLDNHLLKHQILPTNNTEINKPDSNKCIQKIPSNNKEDNLVSDDMPQSILKKENKYTIYKSDEKDDQKQKFNEKSNSNDYKNNTNDNKQNDKIPNCEKIPYNITNIENILQNLQQNQNIIIINQIINSGNVVNNTSNSISNTNNVTNITNNLIDSEEIKELKEKINSLQEDLNLLTEARSKDEGEYQKLQDEVQKLFSEQGFQMKTIQSQLAKITELENKMEQTDIKISELSLAKDDIINSLKEHEDKMNQIENDNLERIKELEEQFVFLNKQNDDLYINKFHEVEKELQKLKLSRHLCNGIDFSFPSNWVNHNDYLYEYEIPNYSQEFIDIQQRFNSTLNSKIIKIIRIQNKDLWRNYCFSKNHLKEKGNDNELLLFHGTRSANPKDIYTGKEEGFDMRFANQGLHGKGIYFHKNAKYSNDYAFLNNYGNKMMFLANVLIGEYEIRSKDREIKMPNYKPNSKNRYDSIKSDVDEIYIVYNNLRGYPTYLLEYK